MDLFIVRHAESVENADKRSGFYQDPRPYSGRAAHHISQHVVGLTPQGFRQAHWLRTALPPVAHPTTQVYTSTYRRAIDTAQIAYPSDLPAGWPRQTSLLDEQHYGNATYMTKREQFASFPHLAAERRLRKHRWTAPGGGESLAVGVRARAAEFIAERRTFLESGGTVIAFTHQTTAVALRALLEVRSLPELLQQEKRRKLPNAAVLHYQLRHGCFELAGFIEPPEER